MCKRATHSRCFLDALFVPSRFHRDTYVDIGCSAKHVRVLDCANTTIRVRARVRARARTSERQRSDWNHERSDCVSKRKEDGHEGKRVATVEPDRDSKIKELHASFIFESRSGFEWHRTLCAVLLLHTNSKAHRVLWQLHTLSTLAMRTVTMILAVIVLVTATVIVAPPSVHPSQSLVVPL